MPKGFKRKKKQQQKLRRVGDDGNCMHHAINALLGNSHYTASSFQKLAREFDLTHHLLPGTTYEEKIFCFAEGGDCIFSWALRRAGFEFEVEVRSPGEELAERELKETYGVVAYHPAHCWVIDRTGQVWDNIGVHSKKSLRDIQSFTFRMMFWKKARIRIEIEESDSE